MKQVRQPVYQAPRIERFGTMRELTQVGCTLGGDGVWICSTPPPSTSPPGGDNGDRS